MCAPAAPCNTRYKEVPATPEVAWSRVLWLGRGGGAPTAPAITTWCCDFRPAMTSGISRQTPVILVFFQGGEMSGLEEKILDRDFLFPMVKTSLLLLICLCLLSTLAGSSTVKLMMATLPPTQART